jgi:hypothetical protein
MSAAAVLLLQLPSDSTFLNLSLVQTKQTADSCSTSSVEPSNVFSQAAVVKYVAPNEAVRPGCNRAGFAAQW